MKYFLFSIVLVVCVFLCKAEGESEISIGDTVKIPDLRVVEPQHISQFQQGELIVATADDDEVPTTRTATGGVINTIMVLLTIFAFIGNGAFLIDVFWLSR